MAPPATTRSQTADDRPLPATSAERGRPAINAGEPTPTQVRLLRELVSETHAPDAAGVLLDAEIDGVRLTLMRRVAEPDDGLDLSPREREIARMIAKGHPNKAIAAVLEISAWTVNTYLRRIFSKLGVCSRAEMVAKLMAAGLLEARPAPPPRLGPPPAADPAQPVTRARPTR
jgi:DNA-binding CsgD family transcriptional regulator